MCVARGAGQELAARLTARLVLSAVKYFDKCSRLGVLRGVLGGAGQPDSSSPRCSIYSKLYFTHRMLLDFSFIGGKTWCY